MSFTGDQLKILKKGLEEVFLEIGVTSHFKLVKTSKRSVSLYIYFPNLDSRTVRISTHRPVIQQQRYINIWEKPEQQTIL